MVEIWVLEEEAIDGMSGEVDRATVRISFLISQLLRFATYPVHGNGDSVVADSAVVAKSVNDAAKNEKQRSVSMATSE